MSFGQRIGGLVLSSLIGVLLWWSVVFAAQGWWRLLS